MKQKPDMNFWRLWNLSFGFFGVQMAYALQSANISRILHRDFFKELSDDIDVEPKGIDKEC